MKKYVYRFAVLFLMMLLSGCGQEQVYEKETVTTEEPSATVEDTAIEEKPDSSPDEQTPEIDNEEEAVSDDSHDLSCLVVIDPGHQRKGNSSTEPNGPGSDTMKAKASGGTSGAASGMMEYELTLEVSLKLRDELVARGYTVKMTRESNDVDISNVQRAEFANEAGADAFVRIHANGAQNPEKTGAMTICQTASNPYNADYYQESRRLSECILDSFVAATGAKKEYVWETDTMTGINWARVPSTIVEMGYMTNPTDDLNMASYEYQAKMVKGIADGIDSYFAGR